MEKKKTKKVTTKKPTTKKVVKKKSKKKAFTLIELLAVIIILGVLMIIAIPAVTSYIQNSRKSAYVNTAQNIVAGARTKVNDGTLGMYDTDTTYYIPYDMIKGENELKSPYGNFREAYVVATFSGTSYDYYWTSVDSTDTGVYLTYADSLDNDKIVNDMGSIDTTIGVGNRSKIVVFNNDGTILETKNASDSIGEKDNYVVSVVINCTFDGELVQGAEYVNGQYTYRYMQEGTYNSWTNMTADGWGVKLTDPNSTDDITSTLCTKINNKPIVTMKYMFYGSKAVNIDFSSFNTSYVTDMSYMFDGRIKAKTLDLSTFNTSKVTTMSNMFAYDQATTTINISSFRTGNVTDMSQMFAAFSEVTELDLSHFDTSKVTNMYNMFYTTSITHLDISSFDTSNVTNMNGMFGTYMGLDITFGPNFKTNNVTNMYGMFDGANRIKELDLSTFNTSKVTNMSNMFKRTYLDVYDLSTFDMSNVTSKTDMFKVPYNRPRTTAAIGYARTVADATALNTGAGTDEFLTFVVKE